MVEILKKYSITLVVLCVFGVICSGCSTFGPANVWLKLVKFKVAEDVNSNAPVGIHLLVIYDKDVLDKLSKMPADRYFAQADQFKKDFDGKVDFYNWEVVPGQNLKDQDISPSKNGGLGVLVFARYSSPGDHRASIADDKESLISLERLDFKVTKIR